MLLQTVRPNIVQSIRAYRVEDLQQAAQEVGQHFLYANLTAAQSKQDEIVARQDGIDDLRHHGLVVSNDAGKNRFFRPQAADEVFANFVSDGSAGHTTRRNRGVQCAQRCREFRGHRPSYAGIGESVNW